MTTRILRAGRFLLLSVCTLAALILLIVWMLSYGRGFHIQLVGATGWELIADDGRLNFNRYGSWKTPDGSFEFAELPPDLPGEIGRGVMSFYYPQFLPRTQWGWQFTGESMGVERGPAGPIMRGSLLLKPTAGGVPIQIGHNIYRLPAWLLVGIFGLWPGIVGVMSARRWWIVRRLRDDGVLRCAACGYDLRATPDRCPECGAVPAGDTSAGVGMMTAGR